MIEFKGHISDKTYQYIKRRDLIADAITGAIAFTLAFPVTLVVVKAFKFDNPFIAALWCTLILEIVFVGLHFLPLTKKQKAKESFYHVFIDDEFIVVEREAYPGEVCKPISDAKCLKDYGDFYEVVYKPLNDYICQKDLISGGTLEEFEALFEGKIKRMNSEKSE